MSTNAVCVADHVSHLENVSEDEINRLLGMVVDVENLFMSVHKEEDTDTKQVYFYLFKVTNVQCSIPLAQLNIYHYNSFYRFMHHHSPLFLISSL